MIPPCMFVAYPDHGLNEQQNHFFVSLVDQLRENGYRVAHRINHGLTDAQIVLSTEESLKTCNPLVVVITDEAQSLSVGWEMGVAEKYGRKILCLRPYGKYVTRNITGLAELGRLTLWDYEKEKEIITKIQEFMTKKLG